MNNVVRHIEYLLTRHDCVVVPGWGAWIVQSVSAAVIGNAAPIPPRKWLSFNAALSHNDGMLAHSLMRAEGCSYDEAMAQITAAFALLELRQFEPILRNIVSQGMPEQQRQILYQDKKENGHVGSV